MLGQSPRSHFDGATAMKPWKRRHPVHGSFIGWILRWGHGDEAVEEARPIARGWEKDHFNGATAMKPWKRPTWSRTRRAPRTLQWGHGDEAVEERIASSWGPHWVCYFNGATAMKPWKRTSPGLTGTPRLIDFNGATAMNPWKS